MRPQLLEATAHVYRNMSDSVDRKLVVSEYFLIYLSAIKKILAVLKKSGDTAVAKIFSPENSLTRSKYLKKDLIDQQIEIHVKLIFL